tara:strand:+ start:1173 stop:1886 length:714 start_codon:yes stop_codon:yes gene_type:complete
VFNCAPSFFSLDHYRCLTKGQQADYILNRISTAWLILALIGFALTFVENNEPSKQARNIFEWIMFATASMFVGNVSISMIPTSTSNSICDYFPEVLTTGSCSVFGLFFLLNQLVFSDTTAAWQFQSIDEGYLQSWEPKVVTLCLSVVFARLLRLFLDYVGVLDRLTQLAYGSQSPTQAVAKADDSVSTEASALLGRDDDGRKTPPTQQEHLNDPRGVTTPDHSGRFSPSFRRAVSPV